MLAMNKTGDIDHSWLALIITPHTYIYSRREVVPVSQNLGSSSFHHFPSNHVVFVYYCTGRT